MSNIVDDLNNRKNSRDRKLFLREVRRYIDQDSKKYPKRDLVEISEVPKHILASGSSLLLKVYRSADYLIQVYQDKDGYIRISVNRVTIYDSGHWQDGISWDDLLWIKRKVGYGDRDAVEVYPRDDDVVNVANIRHLFILKGGECPFVWRDLKDG